MTNKKVKLPVWEHVATESIKNDTWTVAELLIWVRGKVPSGTKDEDISLYFSVYEEPSYYDETIITVNMNLSVRKL